MDQIELYICQFMYLNIGCVYQRSNSVEHQRVKCRSKQGKLLRKDKKDKEVKKGIML